MLKRLLFFLCAALFIYGVNEPKKVSGPFLSEWVVEKNSYLSISGSSNVSPFICEVKEYLLSDTLHAQWDNSKNTLQFQKSYLQIAVKRFDCNAKFMTEEFCKTLKADKCPDLIFKFVSIEVEDTKLNTQSVKTMIDISLAGVTKRLTIPMQMKKNDKSCMRLRGSHQLTFADFNLVPPQKLAGMIKVKQEIMVNFELCFRTI